MNNSRRRIKTREWAKRYIPAEVLGTLGALIAAWLTYSQTHSYVAAAASGWLGEGIGFYGYSVTAELLLNRRRYHDVAPLKRIVTVIAVASTNLLVEFAPAEIIDNFFIRPLLMYIAPQYIHPYPVGFLVGKFAADILFYALAIIGYEARKRWMN